MVSDVMISEARVRKNSLNDKVLSNHLNAVKITYLGDELFSYNDMSNATVRALDHAGEVVVSKR